MFKRYLKDTSGNFAMIMAVSSLVLLSGVGAAVDYTSMTRQSSLMQDYADAAVLAAVIARKKTQGEMQGIAEKTVNDTNVGDITVTTALTLKDDSVRVETTSTYKPLFMQFIGKSSYTIQRVAEAPLATSDPLNIALVLDTTGSMAGTRIASMQKSAKRLVKNMKDMENDKIKISVVPFANYVNVGVANGGKPWMAVEADETIPGTETCSMKKPLISKSGCTTETVHYNNPPYKTTNDGVTTTHPGSSGSYESETCTNYEYGPEEEVCKTSADTTIVWHGCVASREAPFHHRKKFNARPFPGIKDITCSEPLLPLTNKYSTVNSKIDTLTASGETYIPAGLAWGWRTLSVNRPFTEAKPLNADTVSTLILMTDGANTKSLDLASTVDGTVTSVRHNNTDGDAADALSAKLCKKIKNDDIQVYTVAYKFEGPSAAKTKKMLKKCATSNQHFFNAKNAAELDEAFDEIAANLYKIRLSL